MKLTHTLLPVAALLSASHAISLHKREDGPPRVVALNLQRKHIEDPVEHDRKRLNRRAQTVTATLDNEVCVEPADTL